MTLERLIQDLRFVELSSTSRIWGPCVFSDFTVSDLFQTRC